MIFELCILGDLPILLNPPSIRGKIILGCEWVYENECLVFNYICSLHASYEIQKQKRSKSEPILVVYCLPLFRGLHN